MHEHITKLALTYPDRDTALMVARALSGVPDVEAFPPDGWLPVLDANGEEIFRVYYNIAELGVVIDPDTGLEVPGYHLLGAWRGPLETVPAPVLSAHVADRPVWWPQLG